MRNKARLTRRRRFVALLTAATTVASVAPLGAEERPLPVARVTIYPGDRINDSMLEERSFALGAGSEGAIAISKDALLGKVARRTLLPGQPILSIAVDSPRIVQIGTQVKIVFSEGGTLIVAYGVAQQAGAVGELIRVRNQDSGLMVSGRIQADGSIRVSEG
jgi:flagella basal body P-ring formation protein FlgA